MAACCKVVQGDAGKARVVPTAEATADASVGVADQLFDATDLFWGARCVSSARRVLTGGRRGDSPPYRTQQTGPGVGGSSGLVRSVPSSECVGNRCMGAAPPLA